MNKYDRVALNQTDEEKLGDIYTNNEFIMGRKIQFKVPFIVKVITLTYCQLSQILFGLFPILLLFFYYAKGSGILLKKKKKKKKN